MTRARLVGFAGSTSRPSRTRSLVEAIAGAANARHPTETIIYDLGDILPDLAQTTDPRRARGVVAQVLGAIANADALIVGSPVYKGTYAGLFKHLFDLVEPKALMGKPIVLSATGGSERHALAIDHGLRPLFAFFAADILPTAVYATETEFIDYRPAQPALTSRIDRAAEELSVRLDAAFDAELLARTA